MRHLRYVLIVVVCVSMSFGIVFAQDDALEGGTVRGLITDLTPAQNPIEDVEVKIVAQDGGQEFITETDAEGNYKHTGLPAGRYLISISKEGYEDRAGKPVAVVDGGDHFISLKISKKGKIKMLAKIRHDERMNISIKQRILSLLQRVSESVGKRYDLNEAIVEALHQSILDSIEGALEQDGRNILIFGKAAEGRNVALIKILLSHPIYRQAFTKHLNEAQLQDYLDFIEARQQRDRQAVVHWITATLDKELSLRTDQREKIVQSLLDTAENELFPTSMNALSLRPQQAAQLAHYRLKVSLDDLLSEAQSKVWKGLVSAKAKEKHIVIVDLPKADIKKAVENEKGNAREDADVNIKRPFIRKVAPKFVNIEKEVNIVINEIDIQGMQPWNKVDSAESEAQMMEATEAKLTAHTELLGPLDERAARRLALVTKGVVQQYLEAQDAGREAMDEFWRGTDTEVDITNHRLYQQAIKDVLSEEAFARYSEHQAERATLHQQALRGIVVACMDTQLLLDDMQQERLEVAASELIPTPLSERSSPIVMFFQLFPQTVDFEVLTPWQQGECERVFGPIARRR